MLRQSLKQLGVDPIPLLEKAGLDPTARAEDIAVEGFVALARGLVMTRMIRQSMTAYATPLCETIVEAPEPRGTEVLVRISRCGVCHSDLHLQDGYFSLGGDKKLDVTRVPRRFPSRSATRSRAWSRRPAPTPT